MRPTTMQAIIGGAIVMAFCAYWLLSIMILDPPGQLTTPQLTFVSGRVSSTQDVGLKRGYGTLEIWIEGHKLPYRCFDGPFPGSFDLAALQLLGPGADARIGVVTKELESPRTNLAQGQSFYPFVSLELAGKPALSLDAYNEWSRKNQQTATLVVPLFFCCGAYLLYSGIIAKRAGKSLL